MPLHCTSAHRPVSDCMQIQAFLLSPILCNLLFQFHSDILIKTGAAKTPLKEKKTKQKDFKDA